MKKKNLGLTALLYASMASAGCVQINWLDIFGAEQKDEEEPLRHIDLPLRELGDIQLKKGEMRIFGLEVQPGYRYLACTQNPAGNPDLYGSGGLLSTQLFEVRSVDTLMVDEEGKEVPRPDCIAFESDTDSYFIGVHAPDIESSTNIWISENPLGFIPDEFAFRLEWFSDSCTELTSEKYGPFNSAWGNESGLDRPFFDGYPNYIHGGVDIACPASTPVRAMCDGVIADSDEAGGDWGWHTVLQCTQGDESISIAYIHLNETSILPIGTLVRTGDVIGTVFPLQVEGEIEHVHLTACNRKHAECEAAGFQPERGACRRTEWWGAREYWFNPDWRSNPFLYKTLPTF